MKMMTVPKREEGDKKRTTFVAVDNQHKFLGDLFHIYLPNISTKYKVTLCGG